MPSSKHYVIHGVNDEFLGSAQGDCRDGSLSCVIKIKKEYQKRGIGFISFIKLFNELNEHNNIKRFIANWKKDNDKDEMITNFIIYKKNGNVFDTPTGKWMNRIGFTKYDISLIEDNKMTVIFTKE